MREQPKTILDIGLPHLVRVLAATLLAFVLMRIGSEGPEKEPFTTIRWGMLIALVVYYATEAFSFVERFRAERMRVYKERRERKRWASPVMNLPRPTNSPPRGEGS